MLFLYCNLIQERLLFPYSIVNSTEQVIYWRSKEDKQRSTDCQDIMWCDVYIYCQNYNNCFIILNVINKQPLCGAGVLFHCGPRVILVLRWFEGLLNCPTQPGFTMTSKQNSGTCHENVAAWAFLRSKDLITASDLAILLDLEIWWVKLTF